MAWKETDRAAAAMFRTTYGCSDCGNQWRVETTFQPTSAPDCPRCAAAGAYKPPLPGMLTTKSAAIDMAQKIAEEDFGLTNIRDNQRAGDTAVVAEAPPTTAQLDAVVREMKQMAEQVGAAQVAPEVANALGGGFWQSGGMPSTGVAGGTAPHQVDSVGLLEAGREQGISTKMRYDVVGADIMPAA